MGSKNTKEAEPVLELTENQIDTIEKSTDYKRHQIVDFYQNYIKLYPNGEITKEQFQKLYNELFPSAPCDEEYAANIFAAFDDNLSGTICFTEFLIAISISGKADHTEKLRLAFKMYDNNKNGELEMQEISQILEGIRHLTHHDEDGEPVDLMDWDSNGSGTLTEDEFIKFVEAHPKVNKHLTDLFKLNGH